LHCDSRLSDVKSRNHQIIGTKETFLRSHIDQ
jgi:hypothetical protein